MDKKTHKLFVAKLWFANSSNEISEILKEYEEKVIDQFTEKLLNKIQNND